MQRMSSKDEQLLRASTLFDGQCHQMSNEDFKLLASDEVRTHLQHWALIGSALRQELPEQVDPDFAGKVMARINSLQDTEDQASEQLPSLLASKSAFKAGLAAYAESHDYDSLSHASEHNVGAYEPTQNVGAYEPKNVGAYEEVHDVGAYDQVQGVGAYDVSNVGSYEFQTNVAYNQPFDDINQPKTKHHASWLNLKRVGIFVSQIAIAASVALVAVVGLQTYNASDVSTGQIASTAYTNNSAIGGLSLASYANNDSDVMVQLNNQLPHPQSSVFDSENTQADLQQQQQQEIERINLYVRGYVFDTSANK